MGFWTPSNPAATESLAASQPLIQSNFTMIQGVLGSSTLSAGIAIVQGDVFYGAAHQYMQRLAKSTDSCMLTNYGTNNNPSWVKISNMTYTGTFSGVGLITGGVVSATFTGFASSTSQFFGSWVDKSGDYGAQQATTDGFVIATAAIDSSKALKGFTDTNLDPTTVRAQYECPGTTGVNQASIMFPVKKNNYWKVTLGGGAITTVYWIPLGM